MGYSDEEDGYQASQDEFDGEDRKDQFSDDDEENPESPEFNPYKVRKPKKFKQGDKTGGPRYHKELKLGDAKRKKISLEEVINCCNEGYHLANQDQYIGWHHIEAQICALALTKYGAGQPEIVSYHCSNKLQGQLNAMMQRLYGMQSMAGNADFRASPYDVWMRNALSMVFNRKNGLVVKSGKANSSKEKKQNKDFYSKNEMAANVQIPVVENRAKNYTTNMIRSYRMEHILKEELERRGMKTNLRLSYTGRKLYFEKFLKNLQIIPKVQEWRYREEFECPMKQDNYWGHVRVGEDYNLVLRDQILHWSFLNGWAFDCYNDYPEIHQSFDEWPTLARIDQFDWFQEHKTYSEITTDPVPVYQNNHITGAKEIAEQEKKSLSKGPDPILVQRTRKEYDADIKNHRFDEYFEQRYSLTEYYKVLKQKRKERRAEIRRERRKRKRAKLKAQGKDVDDGDSSDDEFEAKDEKYASFKRFMQYEEADPGNILRYHYSPIDLEVARKVVEKGTWEPFADEIAEMEKRNASKARTHIRRRVEENDEEEEEEEEEIAGESAEVEKEAPESKKSEDTKPEKMDVDEPQKAEEAAEKDTTPTFSTTCVKRWTNQDLVQYLQSKHFSENILDKVRAASLQGEECLNLSEDMADNIFGPDLGHYDVAIMKAIRLYGYND